AQPTLSSVATKSDDGKLYPYTLTSRQVGAGLGLGVRVRPFGSPWNLYAVAGLQGVLQIAQTRITAAAQTHEPPAPATLHWGYRCAAGLELALGTGYLVGEAGFASAQVETAATGPTRLGGVQVLGGYRFTF
ncbi:MAG TPA: hypothetical protein VFH51_01970, partial [Myxococcota bacterium]|nr:hypothetical protein [Myxococcota bacterium]